MSTADEWICAEFENLAQVINDYDSHLFLEHVPFAEHHKLVDKSKVFRIVDDRTNKIVLYADSLANPADILARLWSMDSTRGNVLMRLDAHNAAVQALEMRKKMDERAAALDLSIFIAKNTKSRWKHDGIIRDDEFRNLGSGRTVIA